MENMWNSRYSSKEYAYGETPNEFFEQQLLELNVGKILLPAEGEGRNAVYSALHGWEVFAFDFSETAKNKALRLANKHGVSIDYEVCSISDYKSNEKFDCISLIYAHLPLELRTSFHRKMSNLLVPGGTLILEGFGKRQLGKSSGGPNKESMLFSANELRSDFDGLNISTLIEEDIQLNEGQYHQGVASVVRLVATRPK